MIDLSQFVKKKTAVVPIKDNAFQYNRKRYRTDRTEDGWYLIETEGNKSCIVDRAFPGEDEFDRSMLVQGFTFGDTFIFQNGDVGRRKYNADVKVPLAFNTFDSFNSIKAVAWEDHNFYPLTVNYADVKIFEVKSAFDSDGSIDEMKGLTPELRLVFIFHLLERQQFLAELKAAEEAKKKAEFLETIPGRLTALFARAGGKMTGYKVRKNQAEVEWTLPGTRHKFNSVIDMTTMRVIEPGFCISEITHNRNIEDDEIRINVTGLVQIAADYNESQRIYITRRL